MLCLAESFSMFGMASGCIDYTPLVLLSEGVRSSKYDIKTSLNQHQSLSSDIYKFSVALKPKTSVTHSLSYVFVQIQPYLSHISATYKPHLSNILTKFLPRNLAKCYYTALNKILILSKVSNLSHL